MGDAVEADRRGIAYRSEPGLAKLVFVTLFLTIVTVGIYRFWARVRLRRYFWRNIVISGEPLEYVGTGREIFVGFLIAVAILAPLGIVYAVLLRLTAGDPVAGVILRIAYIVGILVLVQIAVFRARRYRLSRTSWRGIRAGQTGSTWVYLRISLVNFLLSVVTLGFYAPWADVALERYKIGHTWFGDARSSLAATGRALFPKWLVVLALCYLPILLAIGLNWSVFANWPTHPAPHPVLPKAPHPGAFWLFLVAVLLGFPATVWYRVAAFRYMASTTRLGPIQLRSEARASAIFGRALAFVGGMLGIYVVFVAIVAAITMVVIRSGGPGAAMAMGKSPLLVLGVVPAYLLIIMASSVVFNCWFKAPVIRHLVATLDADNLEALATIRQSARPRQRFGEGFADSFEIGTF